MQKFKILLKVTLNVMDITFSQKNKTQNFKDVQKNSYSNNVRKESNLELEKKLFDYISIIFSF